MIYRKIPWSLSVTVVGGYYYIYIAVCKHFEPFIYISIYIYGVHCGKDFNFKKTSLGAKEIISM